MEELTSRQRKQLRAMGQRMRATAAVGKAGITDALVASISVLLEQFELVKVHLPGGGRPDREACGAELAERTDSHLVTVVGRTALLYRPSEKLREDRRIHFA